VNFLNSGGVHIGNESSDQSIFHGGLQSTVSDTQLAGLVQSEGGTQHYGNIVLTADTTIDTTLNNVGGAGVTVDGTIDSQTATNHNLDILGGEASTVSIAGNVGDTRPLGSLYISALNVILHDVTTIGEQIYEALGAGGTLGQVSLFSTYTTNGADFDLTGNVEIGDNATVDTTAGGTYMTGDIGFGSAGGTIFFDQNNGTLTLLSGGSTNIRGLFDGSLAALNSATVWAWDNINVAGGDLGNDLTLHAGAFDGNLEANPLRNVVIEGPMNIGDATEITATGDITFFGEFNTYSLFIRLNGKAQSFAFSPINIVEDLDIGGLTVGMGTADLMGSIRGVDSGQAASFGNQIEIERRDDLLFNNCIIEVGCLNFDPSAIVIPVFDPVIYLYEKEGSDTELRYSDLPNTEIWYRLGGAPDIWEERLGDDDEERRRRGGEAGQEGEGQ